MPIVSISMIEGRSEKDKCKLIEDVTNAVENSIGAPRQEIRVLLHEIPACNWGVAGKPKNKL
ncbi:MAG: 4-oxalocrotonate tautomerase [Alphaproteobacteria bacterium]|nr:MAG: 4-oxalocrotonate tautomerase [Alphaproteobacteria bacterium]